MNKTEYIQIMEKALAGNVSAQELQDIVSYYRDYIDMEIRKGKTEQEVLDRLGNPRHLVKSMIAAKEQKNVQNEAEKLQEGEPGGNSKSFRIPLLLITVIVLLLLWLALGFVAVLARFLLPILIPAGIVMGVVWLLKHWKK